MEENMQETKKEKIELTILMPCLNEEANIVASIIAAQSFLTKHNIIGEILICDNGSTDNSPALAKESGARVVYEENPGYGNALRKGIEEALGEYIIMGDCDTTYDFTNLMPFLMQLRDGADFVIGNRFKGGIAKGAMPFSHKYIGVPVLSLLGRIRYNVEIKDFHCGLRGFRSCIAKEISFTSTGMEFATELIARFNKEKAKIVEVPTTLSVSKAPRKPHLKSIRDGIRHIIFMTKRLK